MCKKNIENSIVKTNLVSNIVKGNFYVNDKGILLKDNLSDSDTKNNEMI